MSAVLFLGISAVFAEDVGTQVNVGLNYATAAGLGTRDVREVIFLIINVIFGFLAVAAVLIIIYGGFLWMTAGGDSQKVERAKRVLVNAVIGLIIIFSSYAIAAFVVRELARIAGPGAGVQEACANPGDSRDAGKDSDDCTYHQLCTQQADGSLVWSPRIKDDVNCPAPLSCYPKNITPQSPPNLKIKNVVVRVEMNQKVRSDTVGQESFVVTVSGGRDNGQNCAEDKDCLSDECVDAGGGVKQCRGSNVRGDYAVFGRTLEFRPYRECPAPNQSRRCFSDNTKYNVAIIDGPQNIFCANGSDVDCTVAGAKCSNTFTAGNLVDVTPPEATNLQGKFCEGAQSVKVDVRDNTEVSLVKFFADGTAVDEQSGAFGADNIWQTLSLNPLWAPPYKKNSIVQIKAEASDVDDNSASVSKKFTVRPAYCCNGVWDGPGDPDLNGDPAEARIDCGGLCGACGGESCDADLTTPANPADPGSCTPNSNLCASNACDAKTCECAEPPIIDYVSPAKEGGIKDDFEKPETFDDDEPYGAKGNIITIFGRNFGDDKGKVEFDADSAPASETWMEAKLAEDALIGICKKSWSSTRIVVVVPDMDVGGVAPRIAGGIRVTAVNGFSDITNDNEPGERIIKDFSYTNEPLPGLCQAEPDLGPYKKLITLRGVNLKGPLPQDDVTDIRFGIFPSGAGFILTDKNTIDSVPVPNLKPGTIAWITASAGVRKSNAIPFTVTPEDEGPVIYRYSPANVAVGDYVTLIGARFGKLGAESLVVFLGGPAPQDDKTADILFPEECLEDYWTQTKIIVKVPKDAKTGHILVKRSDGAGTKTSDTQGLIPIEILAQEPKPGICKIEPLSGAAGTTPVTLFGERFQGVTAVNFHGALPVKNGDGEEPEFTIKAGEAGKADTLKTTVPSDAQTGDVTAEDANGKSNGIPFTVGACTSTNSCPDPANQECCLSGEFANSCMLAGQCVGTKNRGAYRWSFVAGNLGPRVILDCQRTNSCSRVCGTGTDLAGKACRSDRECVKAPAAPICVAKTCTEGPHKDADDFECSSDIDCLVEQGMCTSPVSSPAPYYPRDKEVPVNVVIEATFSESMDENTLQYTGDNTGTILVRECGKEDPGDIQPCAGDFVKVLKLVKKTQTSAGASRTFIQLRIADGKDLNPQTSERDFKPDTWYQIMLMAQDDSDADFNDFIQSAIRIPLNGNRGPGSNFIWRFKTRSDTKLGNVGCIDCAPKMETLREKQNGDLAACPPDDPSCEEILGLAFAQDNGCVPLDPSSRKWTWSSSDSTAVELKELKAGGVANDEIIYATAQKETPLENPATVTAELETGHKTQCRVAVDFQSPVVSRYLPRCGTACADAAIQIRFSKLMDENSVKENTTLYTCGGDFACNDLFPIPSDIQCAEIPAGSKKITECNILPQTKYTINGRIYGLVPGNYYRVVVKDNANGAKSTEGVALSGLNFGDSFTYTFRVGAEASLCQLNRVDVVPQSASVAVNGTLVYRAEPYSNPDSCAPDSGQLLDPMGYEWQWKFASLDPANAAHFNDPTNPDPLVLQGHDACGNGVIEPGEDCDDGNDDDGDGCSGTDDAQACLNEGTEMCVNNDGKPGFDVTPCCGNKKVETGEECDPASPVPYCTNTCLWNGAQAKAPFTVCGNNILEAGEECDDGGIKDKDGCSAKCVAEGSQEGRSLCGDGIVGFGEYCEVCGDLIDDPAEPGEDLNPRIITSDSCPDSQFAQGRPSVGNPLVETGECDTSCKNKAPKPVDKQAPYPVCGNDILETGEECEKDDSGCSLDICLRTGSVFEPVDHDPPKIGPFQMVKGLLDGTAKILARAQKINFQASEKKVDGTADLKIGSGIPGGGLEGDFRVLSTQPQDGNNCKNQAIVVKFSKEVFAASVTAQNFIVKEDDASLLNITYEVDKKIVRAYPPNEDWKSDAKYDVELKGGQDGILGVGKQLDCSNGKCTWSFTVENTLCAPRYVEVLPHFASVPPSKWSRDMEPKAYGAYAYDTTQPPKMDNLAELTDGGDDNTPNLKGVLICNETARVCLKAKDNLGNFDVFAKNKDGDCKVDANRILIDGLKPEAKIEKGVLLPGCGIILEFKNQKLPEAGDLWKIDIFESTRPNIPVSFTWEVQELSGDQGNPAVQNNKTDNCAGNSCWNFQAAAPWTPFTGFRQAKVVAKISNNPEMRGSADFFTGNLCEQVYADKNLYGVYPLKFDADTKFLAHFDDTLKALTGSGTADPSEVQDLSFDAGLTNGAKTLGKSVKLGPTAKLSYAAKGNMDAKIGSISFWFKADEWKDPVTFFEVSDDKVLLNLSYDNDTGKLSFQFKDIAEDKTREHSFINSIKDGEWHNIAVTWQYLELGAGAGPYEVETAMFFDGEKVGDVALDAKMPLLEIKDQSFILGSEFEGVFDEFEIRSDNLSDIDVRKRFQAFEECLSESSGGEFKIVQKNPSDTKCVNAEVSAVFSKDVDELSIFHKAEVGGVQKFDNIILCKEEADFCEPGKPVDVSKNIIQNLSYDNGLKKVWVRSPSILDKTSSYYVFVRGGFNGVKSSDGMYLASAGEFESWKFTTGETLCRCERAEIKMHLAENIAANDLASLTAVEEDFFFCFDKKCPIKAPTDFDAINTADGLDKNGDGLGNDHKYYGSCVDLDEPTTSLNSDNLVFQWSEDDPKGVLSSLHAGLDPNDSTKVIYDTTLPVQYGVNSTQNGTARVILTIQGKGTVLNPDTKEKKFPDIPVEGYARTEILAYNQVCSNRWPRALQYYDDSLNNNAPDTHWNFWYCRDRASESLTDDLPAMSENPNAKASSLPKDVIFPLEYHLPAEPLVAASARQEFSGDNYLTVCNNGKDDDNDSKIDLDDTDCGNNPKHLNENNPDPAVDNNRKPVIPESTECSFTLKKEDAWAYQFVVPEDGTHQLYLEVMNFDPDDPARPNDSVNGNPADAKKVFDIEAVYLGGNSIQKKSPSADRRRQAVYFDTGFIKAGKYNIEFKFAEGDEEEPGLWEKNLAVCRAGISKSTKVSDVIGVKVIANPLHLNPATWYQSGFCIDTDKNNLDNVCFTNNDCGVNRCNKGVCGGLGKVSCVKDSDCQKCVDYNVPNRGQFTETTVDGYRAVRSGRTVYVNGVDRDGDKLTTNIYLLSYNENANKDTVEVFSRLLENWRIQGEIEEEKYFAIRNDAARFGDIQDTRLILRDFFRKNNFYPLWDSVRKQLIGGTYIPGLTLSNWPSWQNTFGKELGKTLPKDPVSEFKECPPTCCGTGECADNNKKLCGVNPTTCWDEASLQLYCPDKKSIYAYRSSGSSYELGATFEYTGAGEWDVAPPSPKTVAEVLGNSCGNVIATDLDGDGVNDAEDNCPPSACKVPLDCANPKNPAGGKDCNNDGDKDDGGEGAQEQCNVDGDLRGDKCDFCPATSLDDPDHDGICSNNDNCVDVFNPDQKNSDGVGGGDACDVVCQNDTDGDGVCDEKDNCPNVVNPLQENFDGASGIFQYPPYVPRYCRPGSPKQDTVGNICFQDDHCGGNPGENKYCLTPDQISGEVWPNGQDFGDGCDPNTDHDNDGSATGFCGGYSYINAEKMRLCNVDEDCKGFVPQNDVPQSVKNNKEKCLRLPASSAAKLDNCSVNSLTQPVEIPEVGGRPATKIYSADRYVATFNPGQEDLDRDLVGYLCDQCIDSDNDKFTDAILNDGFEAGIAGWKTNSPEPLLPVKNFRHLDDVSWERRTPEDKAFRGITAARMQVKGITKMVYKTFLPGPSALPANLQNRVNFDEQIQYIIKVKVKSEKGAGITLAVLRGCTNERNTAQFEIPYTARCKGGADEFYRTDTEGFDTLEWNEIVGEFYVNFESAQNEIAFVIEANSPDDAVYVDDFQIFYASNIGRDRGISCENLDKVDNCAKFTNPSRCVGGARNGNTCDTDADCREIAPDPEEKKYASCLAIKKDNDAAGSGYYDIYPGEGDVPEKVYCNMTADGGGWTLVARITDQDGVKNWSAKTSSELGRTWWFNGAPGGRADALGSDYKARAFDSVIFRDIMVTFHKRTDDATKFIYGLYASDVGDGAGVFASQAIWTSPSCPTAYNNMLPVKGEIGANPADVNFEVAGFVLGLTDAPWENPIQNKIQMQVCPKKADLTSDKIENQLVNLGLYQERIDPNDNTKIEPYPKTESPEIAVIGIFRQKNPVQPKDVSPQGLGNWNDGANVGGVFSDFVFGPSGPTLLSSENYALLWFREGDAAVARKGDGVCIQPDFDEDNVGDSCDVCTDRDFDGFGNKGFDIRGCKGSSVKTDNCPVSVNANQADYDTDSNTCDFTLPLPYNPQSQARLALCRPGFEDKDPCCKNPKYFKPEQCGFCGGDACDLDADQDRCYNWEQLRKPTNHEFNLPKWEEVDKNLRLREEGYILFGTNDERTYLSYSSDGDNDGLSSDCDKQTCGNGVLENINDGVNVCQNFAIGARMCEECDLSDFGAKTLCDESNPFGSGTVRNIYPLKPHVDTTNPDADTTFIAHFDSSTSGIDSLGKPILPLLDRKDKYTFTTGLSDGGSAPPLGEAIVITEKMAGFNAGGATLAEKYPNDLVYPAFVKDSDKGTLSFWVKPMNRDVSVLKVRNQAGQFDIPVQWTQGTWHNITGVYDTILDIGGQKVGAYNISIDGRAIQGNVYIPPLDREVAITQLLYFAGLQVDEPNNFLDVALDEVEAWNDILAVGPIAALSDAIFGQCLSSKSQNLNKYMVENFCASCNNLQCQLNYLRTCRPLEGFSLDTSKVFSNPELAKPQNKTEFLWVLDSPSCSSSGNIRRVVAIGGANGKVLGDNYGDVAVSTVDPERGKDNKGDFSVFIDGDFDKNDTFSGTRVWVPYEDASNCTGGSDKGIFREIKLNQQDYSLTKERNCVLGTSDSGITRSTVDMRGNGWAFSPGTNAILMQYLKSQDSDGTCNETAGSTSDHLYRIEGVSNITAMEVDSQNNLWAVRSDDRILKIPLEWIYTEFPNPAQNTQLNISLTGPACKITGGIKSTQCWVFNAPDAGEIALDSKDNMYVAKYAKDSKEVYKILSTATSADDVSIITLTSIQIPRFLTVDIEDNLWVSGEENFKGEVDNIVVRVNTIDKKEILTIDLPLTTNYGIAADSAGSIWVMNEKGNPGNVAQYKLDGTPGKTVNPVTGGNGIRRSAIKTGLSPRIIKIISDVTQFTVPFDLRSVSTQSQGKWKDRWGKILYDVEPASAFDKIKAGAYVSLSNDLANLGKNWVLIEEFNSRIAREPVITMDDYFATADLDREKNKNRELSGRYMKIKFILPPDKSQTIKVKNIRISCRDSAGRNICL